MCAACPTPRLNLCSELRPYWEQHPRYVPHRVRNGYNIVSLKIQSLVIIIEWPGSYFSLQYFHERAYLCETCR